MLDWSGRSGFVRYLPVVVQAVRGGHGVHREGYPSVIYLITALLGLSSAILLMKLTVQETNRAAKTPITWESLMAGIRYIRGTHIVLKVHHLRYPFAVRNYLAAPRHPFEVPERDPACWSGAHWLRAAQPERSYGSCYRSRSAYALPRQSNALACGRFWHRYDRVFGVWRSMAFTGNTGIGGLDMVSVVVRQTPIRQTLTLKRCGE